jgi:DNA-binding XRE family transcriptional regulator
MKRQTLKVFRVTHDLTQKQLADKLGVSVSSYNLIENGARRGSQKFWLKLQHEFNLEGGEVWNLQNNR